MNINTATPFVLTCVIVFPVEGIAEEDPLPDPVEGVVVDSDLNPVANVNVATYWNANGLTLTRLKQILRQEKLKGDEPDLNEMYCLKGRMEPWGSAPAKTDQHGSFSIVPRRTSAFLLAIDDGQQHGGLVGFQNDRPIEITLEPLIRVFGNVRLKQSKQIPDWAVVLMNVPQSDLSPFGETRLAMCGTLDGRFEFLMPPGEYVFEANNDAERMACLLEEKRVCLTAGQRDYDAGILELVERDNRAVLVQRSKGQGTWIDLQERYGEPAPRLYVTEARGVAKEVQINDFIGRWVLVYFWSTWCKPCLADGIPTLMEFHQKHAKQRDQYQILSVCMDKHNNLETLKNLDAYLEPVVRNVWKRQINFPILLDTSFQTSESFGVRGAGITVLIDPNGNIVEGNLDTLTQALDSQIP